MKRAVARSRALSKLRQKEKVQTPRSDIDISLRFLEIVDRVWLRLDDNPVSSPVNLVDLYKDRRMLGSCALLLGSFILTAVALFFVPLVARNLFAMIIDLALILICLSLVVLTYTICSQVRTELGSGRKRCWKKRH